jgi:hypothetical protein
MLSIEPAILRSKDFWTKFSTDEVIHVVAQTGGDRKQREHGRETHYVNAAERADCEEERVAREKRRHDEAGFTEDNQEKQRVGPGTELIHQVAEVAVHVQDRVGCAFD